MPQPVKISDALMTVARESADLSSRSVAGQIEHWARLGREVETIMRVPAVTALKKRGAMTLDESIAQVGTPEGQRRLEEVIRSEPFPHYEAVMDHPDYLTRIEADGTRKVGRFVGREFLEEPR